MSPDHKRKSSLPQEIIFQFWFISNEAFCKNLRKSSEFLRQKCWRKMRFFKSQYLDFLTSDFDELKYINLLWTWNLDKREGKVKQLLYWSISFCNLSFETCVTDPLLTWTSDYLLSNECSAYGLGSKINFKL